jgi:hypothetical protein
VEGGVGHMSKDGSDSADGGDLFFFFLAQLGFGSDQLNSVGSWFLEAHQYIL